MAIYTTKPTGGNTDVAGTWVGDAVPPIDPVTGAICYGHQAVVADGATLTNPAGIKFWPGTSPTDDTGAVALAGASDNGTGVFVNNGWFRFRGPVRQPKGSWTFGAGSVLEHDSSGAADPLNTHYTFKVGMQDLVVAKLLINGALGNRVTIRNAAGSGVSGGWLNGSERDGGQVQATYATITGWGTPTGGMLIASLRNGVGAGVFFDHCIIDGCSHIAMNDMRDGHTYRLLNTTIRNPTSTTMASFGMDPGGNGMSVSPTSGDRRMENVYIEGGAFFFTPTSGGQTGLHIKNVVAKSTATGAPIAVGNYGVTEWSNVLLLNAFVGDGGAIGLPHGTISRTLVPRANAATNPHFVGASNRGNSVIDTLIAEDLQNAGTDGDVIQTSNGAAVYTVDVRRVLVIPKLDNTGHSTLVNHSAPEPDGVTTFAPTVTAEHCTFSANAAGAAGAGGENNSGKAGMFPSLRANLAWRPSAGDGEIAWWHAAKTPVSGTFTNADYNGYWNLTGLRYNRSDTNAAAYSSPPGTHDVALNPGFVDTTRRFVACAQVFDPTIATWQDVMNRFSKMNDDTGAIVGLTVTALIDAMIAGWTPTNTAANTSYPGDAEQFLGIAAAVAAGPTAKQKLFYRVMECAASVAALLLPHISLLGDRHV